jgi:sugar phosphate isomerase/epimerase
MEPTRRSAIAMLAGACVAPPQSRRLPFGFSLYGMKTLPWRDGLAQIARIGYQCTELCLRAGWDTEPKLLTNADRAEIRKRIGDLGLELSSVMENLGRARPGVNRESNLDRLRAAAEVCYECSPGPTALIETTVGGRPDSWDDVKNAMADELGAWTRKIEELKMTLAI